MLGDQGHRHLVGVCRIGRPIQIYDLHTRTQVHYSSEEDTTDSMVVDKEGDVVSGSCLDD